MNQGDPNQGDPISASENAKLDAIRREEIRLLKLDSRFSLPFSLRLPLATSLSFIAGLGLGISHGGLVAGYRFRAENAHRLPTSQKGWYLYHKSKNYNVAYGGVMEGLKMGTKVAIWTAGFFAVEDVFDRYRQRKDFLNTVVASLAVAGGFSLWSTSSLSLTTKLKLIQWQIGFRSQQQRERQGLGWHLD
jgi:hypothetical protein